MSSEVVLSDLVLLYIGKIPFWVLVLPIIVCSMVSLAVIIERLVFFKNIRANYRRLFKKVKFSLSEGREEEALIYCNETEGPIANIIASYLSKKDQPAELTIEEEASNAVKKLEKYMGVISTIATVAPMFGLLGTVTGMMDSFSVLGSIGPGAHDLLASGIGKALITTAFGLFVAIPSLIFYNYMVSKVESYLKDVDFIANGLLEMEEQKNG